MSKYILPSEMQAAAEIAEERGVPLSLGDVDVKDFTPRLKELLKESVVDLLTPVTGWQRIWVDLKRGATLAFDTRDLEGNALQFEDYFTQDLFFGFFVSAFRYPAAIAVKAPVPFAILASSLAFGESALGKVATDADIMAASGEVSPVVAAVSIFLFFIDAILPIVFGRLLLIGFLEERNVRLARSITEAAKRGNGDVVAILGALHVNGVAKLLESTDAYVGDGTEKAGTWWTEELMTKPTEPV